MSYNQASNKQLLKVIKRIKTYYENFIPQRGVAGAGCIPGESPSRSPAICYRMWSDGSYPVLFKDVSQSQMKEAFCLWFQELGQTLPDGLVPEESDEDSECESSSEEDELYFDAESESESESEYASFSRSGPSAAARNSESSHPPPTSTGSPRAFFDVDSASSSSEASGEDDDEDEDWRFNMSEARAAGSQRLVGIGLLSKPSTVSPSSSRESTDDLSLAIPQGDDSKPEAPNDECDDASVDEWFYGIQPPSAEVQCPSTGYHATSLFDVLNEDGVQSPESRDDHDVRSSFALPESCFATSSHSSSHVPDGPYSGAAPGEEYTETSLSTDPNSAERPDGVAATASTDGLLPLESIIHWEKLLFTFDAAEDREPVQQAPASTIPSSVEVAQASTSSGRKRARESEDESEDAALAGPSKKRAVQTKREDKEEGKYRCTIGNCTGVYKHKGDLARHLRTSKDHALRALECPQCKTQIPRMESFLRHFEADNFVECLERLLVDMKVKRFDQVTTRAVKAKYDVAYTPQKGARG